MNVYRLLPDKTVVEARFEGFTPDEMNLENRKVECTTIGNLLVSTTFLGMDHRWHGGGPPLVFKTMIFAVEGQCQGWASGQCWLYSNWNQAVKGHAEAVKLVKRKMGL